MTKIIVAANQKGGVAKSSTVLNIAYAFANHYHQRILVVDMDAQATASQNLGIDVSRKDTNTIDMIMSAYVDSGDKGILSYENLKKYIYTPVFSRKVHVPGTFRWESRKMEFGKDSDAPRSGGCLDCIPSSIDLSDIERKAGAMAVLNGTDQAYPFYLRDILQPVIDGKKKEGIPYDWVIIDTPPALGVLSFNSLCAAKDGIIIPTNMDVTSLRGIKALLQTVDEAVRTVPGHAGVLGILLSQFYEHRTLDNYLKEYSEEFYPNRIFHTTIPDSNDAKKANAEKILFSQKNRKAYRAFISLCGEIIEQTEKRDEHGIQG